MISHTIYYSGHFSGIANAVPYIGPVIGIIPPFIMSIVESGSFEALPIIILLFIVIQIIDVTLIQPTVVAKSVDLHPLIIIFTVFAGGTFLGVIWNVVCRVACRNYKSYHH